MKSSKIINLADYGQKRKELAMARMTPEQLYNMGLQLAIASLADRAYSDRIAEQFADDMGLTKKESK